MTTTINSCLEQLVIEEDSFIHIRNSCGSTWFATFDIYFADGRWEQKVFTILPNQITKIPVTGMNMFFRSAEEDTFGKPPVPSTKPSPKPDKTHFALMLLASKLHAKKVLTDGELDDIFKIMGLTAK